MRLCGEWSSAYSDGDRPLRLSDAMLDAHYSNISPVPGNNFGWMKQEGREN
jgi:hypothetical protein